MAAGRLLALEKPEASQGGGGGPHAALQSAGRECVVSRQCSSLRLRARVIRILAKHLNILAAGEPSAPRGAVAPGARPLERASTRRKKLRAGSQLTGSTGTNAASRRPIAEIHGRRCASQQKNERKAAPGGARRRGTLAPPPRDGRPRRASDRAGSALRERRVLGRGPAGADPGAAASR